MKLMKILLQKVDVEKLSEKLKKELEKASEQKRAKLIKTFSTLGGYTEDIREFSEVDGYKQIERLYSAEVELVYYLSITIFE